MPLIETRSLVKEFPRKIHKRRTLRREKTFIRAVDGVTFDIDRRELVGYIGPNGAGKSTTIKMLTGILVPTSGMVRVDGRVPYENRRENAKRIGDVFGQRSQLWWDLGIEDTYNLMRHMYRVERRDYEARIDLLKDLLGLQEFWGVPVRELSLGQRMQAEIGAALIHSPSILFLDEPTIGLDALVKERIRRFLVDINEHDQTTVILTTHDLEEVERTCSRVMVINHGKILFDGSLSGLRERCRADSFLTVEFHDRAPTAGLRGLNVAKRTENAISISFKRHEVPASELVEAVFAYARSQAARIKDIAIEEPPIDAVIKELYEAEPGNEEQNRDGGREAVE